MAALEVTDQVFDSYFAAEDESHSYPSCTDTNCALLPLGFVLLSMDSYFDLCWCLWPSRDTSRALVNYYTTILTPSLLQPLPLYPGYFYPLYVIYKLCWTCSTMYNWALFLLYLPLAYRYVDILSLPRNNRGDLMASDCHVKRTLLNWWTVVALRVVMAVFTTMAVRVHGNCTFSHAITFWTNGWF